ncbi:MAG TPA: endopeptidase La [Actinopolymorphaceae bacterium]
MPDTNTLALPVLPLSTGVVLPGMVVTIAAESADATAAIEAAETTAGQLLLVPRVDGGYAKVGTLAQIENSGDLPGGGRGVVVRGLSRAVIGAGLPTAGRALWVNADPVVEPPPSERDIELAREYRAVVESILEQRGGGRIAGALREISEPGQIADTAGYWPDLTMEQRVQLLETVDVTERLELVLGWAREALAEMTLKQRVQHEVDEGLERSQREYLLRQQLAAIRKELGEDDDIVAEYRERIAAAGLPEAVREAAEKEVSRLERMGEQNPEHGWVRTWLDTILELPWNVRSEETRDLDRAREVLDADHTGLSDPKERILEYLAVRKLRAERGLDEADGPGGRRGGAILALVGPPGVGKTSLGESVARATGRTFVRVALGGVRDEAEIRGHRRTYVGAQPGRIVRALKEAGTMNPVFLLDEVDKVGSDWRGDPASALLEVLDPAQNHTFRDHYLEVELDLSDVLFLATANIVDTIPPALLDRMEVVTLDGYTEDEKVAIGRDHLLPRALERAALSADEVQVDDSALRRIAAEYTREAGVRNLERAIAKILRKVATALATGEASAPVKVSADDLKRYLGRPRFLPESARDASTPGVATGLAVTGAGGDVLYVEAATMAGEPGLTLTGQLGDVMKESAQIAVSYLRANGDKLGVPVDALASKRIHVHVPAGAVPKDGPSAGVTIAAALASLLSGRPVRTEIGMTGEVSLTGRVLPIGGVKQKLLAAHRAGLTEVVLPRRNEPDLDDVPDSVLDDLTVHLVDNVAEVLELALRSSSAPQIAAA